MLRQKINSEFRDMGRGFTFWRCWDFKQRTRDVLDLYVRIIIAVEV